MKKPHVFIAESSDQFTCLLSEALILDGTFEISGTAITGIETLEMIQRSVPDILVLDLLITLKDGINILKELCTYQKAPVVIATTAFESEYLLKLAYQYGACCIIKKPCTVESIVQSMKEHIHDNRIADPMLNSITLERDITALLRNLALFPTTKGYHYLKEAIEIAIFHPIAVTEIKKDIYMPMGRKYGLTAEHISSEINKTLRGSIERLNNIDYYSLLGIRADTNNITAAELIATVANKLLYRI